MNLLIGFLSGGGLGSRDIKPCQMFFCRKEERKERRDGGELKSCQKRERREQEEDEKKEAEAAAQYSWFCSFGNDPPSCLTLFSFFSHTREGESRKHPFDYITYFIYDINIASVGVYVYAFNFPLSKIYISCVHELAVEWETGEERVENQLSL